VTFLVRFTTTLILYADLVILLDIGLIFIILPIVNHVRIFFTIRRHNIQMQDAVSGQNLAVIFRREKKAAIDMFIVIAVLMLCLAPAVAANILKMFLGDL